MTIPKGVHGPPKSFVAIGHEAALRDQPLERLVNEFVTFFDVVEDLLSENEITPVDPHLGFVARAHCADRAALVETRQMKRDGRMNGDEAGDLSALLESLDHFRQGGVGQAIAVVGEKIFVILHELADGEQTLTDVAPYSGVDQRYTPIRRALAQQLDLVAKLRDRAVAVGDLTIVQKVILHNVRLVAEAQDEIPMTILAVVLHDVPKDGLMPDRDHRLGDTFGIFANPRTQPATEQYDLHGLRPFSCLKPICIANNSTLFSYQIADTNIARSHLSFIRKHG